MSYEQAEAALNTLFASHSNDEVKECLISFLNRIEKVITNAKKCREIKTTKEAWQRKVGLKKGGIDFYKACGFREEGEKLVLSDDDHNKMFFMRAKMLVKRRAMEDAGCTEADFTKDEDEKGDAAPAIDPDSRKIQPISIDMESDLSSTLNERMSLSTDFDLSAAIKASSNSKLPKSSPAPMTPEEIKRLQERMIEIDADFFQFSNYRLRPGAQCGVNEVAVLFQASYLYRWQNYSDHQLSPQEAQEAFARWNAKYAKMPHKEGFYYGIQLSEKTPAPLPIVPVETTAATRTSNEQSESADEETPKAKNKTKKKATDDDTDEKDTDEAIKSTKKKVKEKTTDTETAEKGTKGANAKKSANNDKIDDIQALKAKEKAKAKKGSRGGETASSPKKTAKSEKKASSKTSSDDEAVENQQSTSPTKKKVVKKKAAGNSEDDEPNKTKTKKTIKKKATNGDDNKEDDPVDSKPKKKAVKKKGTVDESGEEPASTKPKKKVVKKKSAE